jgi:hypothetical protein
MPDRLTTFGVVAMENYESPAKIASVANEEIVAEAAVCTVYELPQLRPD